MCAVCIKASVLVTLYIDTNQYRSDFCGISIFLSSVDKETMFLRISIHFFAVLLSSLTIAQNEGTINFREY